MNYTIKTISGEEFEITEEQYKKVSAELLSNKVERAEFIRIGEGGPVVAMASISAIVESKKW